MFCLASVGCVWLYLSGPVNRTSRFETKISHVNGCLTHLTTLELFPSNITTSHNQELHGQLHCIEQNIASIEMAEK